jgi:hypothetical protein
MKFTVNDPFAHVNYAENLGKWRVNRTSEWDS